MRAAKVAGTLSAARFVGGVVGAMLLGAATAAWASVTVTLTAPANGSTYVVAQPTSIVLSATASAGAGYTVSKVEFFQGTSLVGTDTKAPYSITWSNFPSGNYTLTAKATATKNGSPSQTATSSAVNITVTVNARPNITWTGPADGTTFGGPVTITASVNATDSDGTIAQVFFAWQDLEGNYSEQVVTQLPYTVPVPLDLGCGGVACDYWINSWAVDNLGARSNTVGVYIHVQEDVSPSVTLTSPSSSATFTAPANITVTASASDPDGTIAKVELYQGATLITTLTATPYTYNWTNVPAGSYSLTAVATDNVGATKTSVPVAITVSSAVAQIYYIVPDHLNTPRLIQDKNANVVWKWDQTEPFGATPPNDDPDGDGVAFDLPLRLPGQYYDRETGLYYNYFRDYDPSTGRYPQSDPIGLKGGLNTYSYVLGAPLRYADPRGLWMPWIHKMMTEEALARANCNKDDLPLATADVDILPGSQDPRNAIWHHMSDGIAKQSSEEARDTYETYLKEHRASCETEDLARVLHDLQDGFPRGHRDFQPWQGRSWRNVGALIVHGLGDMFPSPTAWEASISATVSEITAFKARCPCACK